MKQYHYILFDLDGTLTESAEGIQKSFLHALKRLGAPTDGFDVRKVIGPPIRDSFMKLCGLSPEQADAGLSYYRERFSKIGIYENRLYEGIDSLLEKLFKCGVTLATATSKPESYTLEILKYFKIDRFFSQIAGATLDRSRATKEAVLDYVLKRLGSPNPDQVLMVGDTKFDLIGAAAFGIDAVGVSYGYGTREELQAHPHVYLADTVKALETYLLGCVPCATQL